VKLKIEIDSKAYEVEVEVIEEDSAPSALNGPRLGAASSPPPLRQAPPPPAVADERACRSPIAGVVVKVLAGLGQQVKPNEPLLVLEAMKMESSITAPAGGTVARIHVKPGDGVQIGQTLVEIE
jgi:methylmalonyl-CoA carboxyltransferase small subunit